MIFNEKIIKRINHYSQIKLINSLNSLLQKYYFFIILRNLEIIITQLMHDILHIIFNEKSII